MTLAQLRPGLPPTDQRYRVSEDRAKGNNQLVEEGFLGFQTESLNIYLFVKVDGDTNGSSLKTHTRK